VKSGSTERKKVRIRGENNAPKLTNAHRIHKKHQNEQIRFQMQLSLFTSPFKIRFFIHKEKLYRMGKRTE
jgi:hypothetical protein